MELTFITYNIHKGIGNDRLYRLDRIIHIIRELQPDILALQEVSMDLPRSAYDDIARIVAGELGMHFVMGLNVQGRKGGYGNATFSRYPLHPSDNLDLKWSVKKARGCLNSVAVLPGDIQVGIMNFHLGLAGIERKKQIGKILDSDFLIQNEKNPVVMLGDTNDVYNRLKPIVHAAGFKDAGHKRRKTRTFPSFAPIWKLDRIFYNKHFSLQDLKVVKDRPARMASDHLPMVVKLRVNTPRVEASSIKTA